MFLKCALLVLFFAVMTGVGVYCRKTASDVQGFVLGGRNVGSWLTAFAFGTSYFSAVIFVGYAGQFGWKYGIAATWIGIGNALKVAASVIVFIFLIPYTASLYNGLSRLFSMAFSVDYVWCVLGMALLTGIYVWVGGYMATAVNDFIQGLVMLVGICAVIASVLGGNGGFTSALQTLSHLPSETAPALSGAYVSFFGPQPLYLLGVVLLTSLGTWGLPQMVGKFYAIRSEAAIRKGTFISTLFAIIVAFIIATRVYHLRMVYLMPYVYLFTAVSAQRLINSGNRLVTRLSKAYLVGALAFGSALAVVAMNYAAWPESNTLTLLTQKLKTAIPAKAPKVCLVDFEHEFYYAGRQLGWRMYSTYDRTKILEEP